MKGTNGKKTFSPSGIYASTVNAARSMGTLRKSLGSGLMSMEMNERLMLAVTSVNRCAMCSYAHTEMALEAGLSREEIRSFLDGDFPDIPDDEAKAVLFAENYAEMRGRPSHEAWNAIVSAYGKKKAEAILSSIRMIMAGNAWGIVYGSLANRLRGKGGDDRSSLAYELLIVLLTIPFLALGCIQGILMDLFRLPKI